MPDEDIINYDTSVKRKCEAARYNDMTSEESRVLYTILTTNNTKLTEECLKQVTGNMGGLNTALLASVWQKNAGNRPQPAQLNRKHSNRKPSIK